MEKKEYFKSSILLILNTNDFDQSKNKLQPFLAQIKGFKYIQKWGQKSDFLIIFVYYNEKLISRNEFEKSVFEKIVESEAYYFKIFDQNDENNKLKTIFDKDININYYNL